jgi:hypothetical protein
LSTVMAAIRQAPYTGGTVKPPHTET